MAQVRITERSIRAVGGNPTREGAGVPDGFDGLNIEVSMFPGGTGDKGGIDLTLSLQLKQQL